MHIALNAKSPVLTDLGNILSCIPWQFINNFTIFYLCPFVYCFNCYNVHIHVCYVFIASVCLIICYSCHCNPTFVL